MIKNRVDIISMGCSKNLVDSERLSARLAAIGYSVVFNPETPRGEVVVINTCGFIREAKEENIRVILGAIGLKARHRVGRVYVMGCLTERYRAELTDELPEVDGIYGKFDWDSLIRLLSTGRQGTDCPGWQRRVSTPAHYAYLKIAEGCSRSCAYCAIPQITGPYHSRPMDEILTEAADLARRGVKEIALIAQDTTFYGVDLAPLHRQLLPELVERLSQIDGIEWIRIHYAYPAHFPDDLIRVMADCPKVVHYIDLPLQHISDHILSAMRRKNSRAETIELIQRLRRQVPDIAIRTTLMVGFPGESEADFSELLRFVNDTRFERLGVFKYCEEENTPSARDLTDDVPEEVKQQRYDAIMAAQEQISASLNQALVGRELRVLVDEETDDCYIGRTQWDTFDGDDNSVLITKSPAVSVGHFITVRITGADDYDLFAEPLTPSKQ